MRDTGGLINDPLSPVWMCENCGSATSPDRWELDYCERCYVRDAYDELFFEGTWDECEVRWNEICAERSPASTTAASGRTKDLS